MSLQTYIVHCPKETSNRVLTRILHDIQIFTFPGSDNDFLKSSAGSISILYTKRDGFDSKYFLVAPKFVACAIYIRHGYLIVEDCADAIKNKDHIEEMKAYLAKKAQIEVEDVNVHPSFNLHFDYSDTALNTILTGKVDYNAARQNIDDFYEDETVGKICVS